MSKLIINEEAKQAQDQLKKNLAAQINDPKFCIYAVDWTSSQETKDDEMGEIIIKYREHDEVEVNDNEQG